MMRDVLLSERRTSLFFPLFLFRFFPTTQISCRFAAFSTLSLHSAFIDLIPEERLFQYYAESE